MNMFGLNTQKPYFLFLLVVAMGLLSYSVQSMRFDLSYKGAKCFSEDVMKNSMIVGNYSILNLNEGNPLPSNHTITVQLFPSFIFTCHFCIWFCLLLLVIFDVTTFIDFLLCIHNRKTKVVKIRILFKVKREEHNQKS